MGMRKKPSSSIFDIANKTPPNPNPKNYMIKNTRIVGRYIILYINYPDCTNFEGNKILVFKDINYKDLLSQEIIDPHFSDNKNYYSPIARFAPTEDGKLDALNFCTYMISKKKEK